ncbi:MAG: hypothetical protein RMJ28_03350 [Nitrososphaerota archaeon]|nr:hypothetical protein [Nitrososphaerota archaeon]
MTFSAERLMSPSQFFDMLYINAYILFLLGLAIYALYVIYTNIRSD